MECGKTRKKRDNASKNNIKLKRDYAETFSETNVIEIQRQHWGGNSKLSIEGVVIEYFPNSFDQGGNENMNLIHI